MLGAPVIVRQEGASVFHLKEDKITALDEEEREVHWGEACGL